MPRYVKRDFPVDNVRRLLEPGPVLLVTSAWRGERNVMTMAWQTCLEFTPSLVGCVISEANYSFDLVRKSKECVLNLPTVDLAETVVRVGNSTGAEIDKFVAFGLTPASATKVKAPLIQECYANFECRLVDTRFVKKYNFFVWEVLKAHVATSPKVPRTIHYRGDGEFMISGEETRKWRRLFKPEML